MATGQTSATLACGLLVVLTVAVPARGAGTPGGAADAPDGQTPDQAAMALYQSALTHKEAALALEKEAAGAPPADREKLLDSARGEYRAVIETLGRALKLDLDYYQAANELGFALRRTGEYRKALGAYNFALTIKPDFYPAIEYRGEAYLHLGRLEDAKAAYMTLFRNDLALAGRLLVAMADLDVEDDAFRAWVAERQRLAAVTPGG
ncbi:MAG: tetratricopeptide repeat protein, partial [Pseudomonadales bacterium]